MEEQKPESRDCPACGSGEYQFRAIRKVPPESGQADVLAVETKYLCKKCGHEWKLRTPK